MERHAAILARADAYHEAGHVWAAALAGLNPQSASALIDGPRLVGSDEETTLQVAAAGLFAQGLLLEADDHRRDFNLPADEILNLIELEEFIEPGSVTQDIM